MNVKKIAEHEEDYARQREESLNTYNEYLISIGHEPIAEYPDQNSCECNRLNMARKRNDLPYQYCDVCARFNHMSSYLLDLSIKKRWEARKNS